LRVIPDQANDDGEYLLIFIS